MLFYAKAHLSGSVTNVIYIKENDIPFNSFLFGSSVRRKTY